MSVMDAQIRKVAVFASGKDAWVEDENDSSRDIRRGLRPLPELSPKFFYFPQITFHLQE
jgi:hypothetical protein